MNKYEGLDYQWIVELKDGTKISQFDKDGDNEVLFRDVRNKDIKIFWLMNTVTLEDEFAVDLSTGKFLAFGKWVAMAVGDKIISNSEYLKYRLIYYRSVTKHFGTSLEALGGSIVFVIGWQANDPVTGLNIKRLLQVHNSETIAIG